MNDWAVFIQTWTKMYSENVKSLTTEIQRITEFLRVESDLLTSSSHPTLLTVVILVLGVVPLKNCLSVNTPLYM